MNLQEELQAAKADLKMLRWYAIVVDETPYWNLEMLQTALSKVQGWEPKFMPKAIMCEYVASPDVGVHICSFERNAEAFFVQNYALWEEGLDVPEEVVDETSHFILGARAEEEDVRYFGWNFFRNIVPDALQGEGYKFIGVTDKDDPEAFDALFESEIASPSF